MTLFLPIFLRKLWCNPCKYFSYCHAALYEKQNI